MKKIYLFAAMAAMLASCSSDDLSVEKQTAPQAVEDGAVMFDAYVNRATTRAGQTGDMDKTAFETDHNATTNKGGGFGVFAYYTENKEYDQQSTPNFMYNQLVKHGTSGWEYSPVKYWPNEYGNTAVSADQEKITFFAYAPYVDVDVASGKVVSKADGDDAWGITALSRNTAAGDPIVKYVASFKAAEAVDLLWGVSEQNTWAKTVDGQQQVFTFGMPWIDVQRPYSTDQRMKFTFKHATAKMQVNIDHFVDDVIAGKALKDETRIYIRSVRFNGFAMKGALNLNNEDPNKPHWLNFNGVGELESTGDVVVYDGRRDGKEAMANAIASNEKALGLNKEFIQTDAAVGTDAWTNVSPLGVTATAAPLFEGGGIFYVIPIPDTEVEVEIVYDVETIDKNLAGYIADGKTHGSSVENHITKTINFGGTDNAKLEAGKAYIINLHLGMNSVKFDAEVTDWENMVPGPDVDLPANMPVFAAGATGTKANADINGMAEEYIFAVSGLNGGEYVTPTGIAPFATVAVNSNGDFTTPDGHANASGVAYVKVTSITQNKGVQNKKTTDAIKIVGVTSEKEVTLTIKQLAEKLALTAPTTKTAAISYQLKREAAYYTTDEDFFVASTAETPVDPEITVWLNGTKLSKAATTPGSNKEFGFTSKGVLSFSAADVTKDGDIIKITIKTGDVAEETISFEVE